MTDFCVISCSNGEVFVKPLSLEGMVFCAINACSWKLDDAAGGYKGALVDYGPFSKILTLFSLKLVVKLS